VPREVAGVERVPDAEREHEQRQRDISRRRPVPPTRRRPESRRGVGQARIRVRGAQDAEHLAQLVDGLAAGPLDRGKRPAGTLGLAHEHLFGARRLQHHLADGVSDRVVSLVRHAVALTRHRDALADRALLLQPRCELAQPCRLDAVGAHAATRQPRHADQQHYEGVVLSVPPQRVERRQPCDRREHRGERAPRRGVRADRVGGQEDQEHERVGVLPPRCAESSVERRCEHRDACKGHDRHPPARGERQRRDRGKRGAARAESTEHDLELRRDQQRGGQADVYDETGVPSPASAAVHGPHAVTVPTEAAPGIVRSEHTDHPQV
jgi:hypothetical protein